MVIKHLCNSWDFLLQVGLPSLKLTASSPLKSMQLPSSGNLQTTSRGKKFSPHFQVTPTCCLVTQGVPGNWVTLYPLPDPQSQISPTPGLWSFRLCLAEFGLRPGRSGPGGGIFGTENGEGLRSFGRTTKI